MDLEKVFSLIYLNWPFVAVAVILAIVGEVVKSIVIKGQKTDQIGLKGLFVRTLPLHPVIAGGLLGLVLSATIPEELATGGTVSSILYFALSGALSTWIYNFLKKLFPDFSQAVRTRMGGGKASKDSTPPEPPQEP